MLRDPRWGGVLRSPGGTLQGGGGRPRGTGPVTPPPWAARGPREGPGATSETKYLGHLETYREQPLKQIHIYFEHDIYIK